MCVNSLNSKTVCKKAAGNLMVLDFCINTHNYPYNITETTTGCIAVVEFSELQSTCSPQFCCAYNFPLVTY